MKLKTIVAVCLAGSLGASGWAREGDAKRPLPSWHAKAGVTCHD